MESPHQNRKPQRCHKKNIFVYADEGADANANADDGANADANADDGANADIIYILKGGAFKGPTVGAVENADITTYVHLPDLVYTNGVWHYCPVISGNLLSSLYEGQYILCDAWYAIFPMEDECDFPMEDKCNFYIPIEIVHPVHIL
jgi:hypothetical protein